MRRNYAGFNQRRGKHCRSRLSKQLRRDESRDDQGTVRGPTDQRPIPEYSRLGKRSGRMAISLKPADGAGGRNKFPVSIFPVAIQYRQVWKKALRRLERLTAVWHKGEA